MNYDIVFSLGANCSVAHQLRRRFMRPFSLPFDWLLVNDSKTFAWLAGAFENRFSNFMRIENLVELRPGDPLYVKTANLSHVPYYDKVSGYRFLHLFDGSIESSRRFYEAAREVMQRRLERLYGILSRGGRACLVVATGVPVLNEHLLLLEKSLLQVFPKTHFTIRLMQFESDEDTSGDDGVNVGNCIQRFGYKRRMNDYDFFQTNWEWHYLDSLRVPYDVKSTHRWQYRLWKHLDKKLK